MQEKKYPSIDMERLKQESEALSAGGGVGFNVDPPAFESFSQVYGIMKHRAIREHGIGKVRMMTLRYLNEFPESVVLAGLRKIKARYMYQCICNDGKFTKGNHHIEYYDEMFTFYYRDTPIYHWHPENDVHQDIHAGDFEDTTSTKNQRKEIRHAIENFVDVLDAL